MSERPASGTATVAIPSALSISNKPMVPTAPNPPAASPLYPLRRHIGQSLGSRDERRATSFEEHDAGQREVTAAR